jgi:hypothetical protein
MNLGLWSRIVGEKAYGVELWVKIPFVLLLWGKNLVLLFKETSLTLFLPSAG